MSFADTIERWFREERRGSLLLPDGWWGGRPYDNLHELTSVDEAGNTLTVILDRKLTLRFEGLKSVEAREGELILGPFDRLCSDWKPYGTDIKRETDEYRTGIVKILRPPG